MQTMSGLIGQTLGQYRIIDQIGEGGMAAVFKAYQPGLNREVALKVLPPHFATTHTDFIERFAREAQAIGNLHHPNILPVYDSGLDKGYSYLVMRYIPNARTLADEMRAPLKTERVIEVIGQVAGALDHAHKAGIIHRDVKPSNVLLDGAWALLSDFGLAKMVESTSELTGSGVGMGTPAYMSPEQGLGKKVDRHTDIYALGIILYEMLTGQVPHRAETPIATVLKRINEPLPLPRQINPNIPEAVELVLLKTLAADPTQRFDSAGEMAAALKAAFGPAPADITPGPEKTQPAVALATDPSPVTGPTKVVSPLPAKTETGKKSGLPLVLAGIGVIGMLLMLILVGIGVLLVRQQSASKAELATPIEIAQEAVDAFTPEPDDTPEIASEDTVTPVASTAATDSLEPPATPASSPTDFLSATVEAMVAAAAATVVADDATAAAAESTATPAIVEVATAADYPAAAAAAPAAASPAAPVAAALTGQEAYNLALAEAQKWQPDAVLSEIGTLSPLNTDGKSTGWSLKFWSPSRKGLNSIMFMDGAFTTMPADLPVPQAVTVGNNVILDTKRLYDTAEAGGAAKFTAQGYRPSASLVPYPVDESRLTWYLNYQGGDYRVVFTVIIDALSGEIIQAIATQ